MHQPSLLMKSSELLEGPTSLVPPSSEPYGSHRDWQKSHKKRESKRAGLIKAMSRRPGFEYAKRSPSVESVYRRPGLIRHRVWCFSCYSSHVHSSDAAVVPFLSSTPLSIILKLVSRALKLPSSVVVINLFVHHCLCFPTQKTRGSFQHILNIL